MPNECSGSVLRTARVSAKGILFYISFLQNTCKCDLVLNLGCWGEAEGKVVFWLICFWIKMHSKWPTLSLIFLGPSGTVWRDCLCLGYFLLCIVHAGKYIRLISLYKAGIYYTLLFKDIQQFLLSERVFMLWNFVLEF